MVDYRARINRVIDYIDRNLGEELALEALADVACFSKYHFHRIFAAHTGETLGAFIQRLRVQRAAQLLAGDPERRVLDIALECGFSGQASFARSFKERYGMTAGQWRKVKSNFRKASGKPGDIEGKGSEASARPELYVTYADGGPLWRLRMDTKEARVETRTIEKKHLAYVRHVGPYAGNAELFKGLWARLFSWAGARGLITPGAMSIVIYHDDPEVVAPEKLRTSICLTVPEEQEVSGEIGLMDIEGGRYGVGSFTLAADEYSEAWNWMYGTWLPSSGFVPDERACFENYPAPPLPDGRCVVEIWVPVKPA